MKYTLELRIIDKEVMNFDIEHDTDKQALETLDNTLNTLLNSESFCKAIEYYEFYRVEDNNRVVIDENYFV